MYSHAYWLVVLNRYTYYYHNCYEITSMLTHDIGVRSSARSNSTQYSQLILGYQFCAASAHRQQRHKRHTISDCWYSLSKLLVVNDIVCGCIDVY
jgi:hypothetical protein